MLVWQVHRDVLTSWCFYHAKASCGDAGLTNLHITYITSVFFWGTFWTFICEWRLEETSRDNGLKGGELGQGKYLCIYLLLLFTKIWYLFAQIPFAMRRSYMVHLRQLVAHLMKSELLCTSCSQLHLFPVCITFYFTDTSET